MKKVLNKISDVIRFVYGYGIAIGLFLGGAMVLGYIAALIIGGDTATAICNFIYKNVYYYIILVSVLIVLMGLLAMYLSGETAMKLEKKKTKKK